MRVLVIDNYDSFVYNLAQYIGGRGAQPLVFRNNEITIGDVERLGPDRIVISPGPGSPDEPRSFGVCSQVLREASDEIPTLGVCLGHQGIVSTFGGRVKRAGRLMHGKTSLIRHRGVGLFRGLRNPFTATRYHSLVIDRESLPPCLEVTAESLDDSEVMGVHHLDYPIDGVQFHPESILTREGMKLIANFLEGGRDP